MLQHCCDSQLSQAFGECVCSKNVALDARMLTELYHTKHCPQLVTGE